jgi:hypothetical protein
MATIIWGTCYLMVAERKPADLSGKTASMPVDRRKIHLV